MSTAHSSYLSWLRPLASLRLTVLLFALSIVLVLAGTLAQVDKDIWDAVRIYFRCWVTWLELRSLAPVMNPLIGRMVNIGDLPPSAGCWFPGGYTLGGFMLVNLVAAHALKFTVQAKGVRAIGGLALTLLGVLVTWLVIESGHGDTAEVVADSTWDSLWVVLKWSLVLLTAANVAGIGWQSQRDLQNTERKAELIGLCLSLLGLLIADGLMFAQGGRGIDASGMRILWQLIKGTFAGLVLLGGCWLLFKKRAGIVVLHAGVILMLVHEPIVGTLHIEQQMQIEEGKTVNYAEDIRTVELAFVDTSNAEFDDVVTIPKELLVRSNDAKDPAQKVIKHESLPFDVEVVQYLQNSQPEDAIEGKENLATAGVGKTVVAKPVDAGTGTDSGGAVDLTATYFKLLDKKSGKELGTYLAGVYFNLINRPEWQPNRITHDGTTWNLALRFRRYHKPYSVKLLDVSKTDYDGTSTPRDYRSVIELTDAGSSTRFERHIWMNNPLRYAGETFYQTSYSPPDPRTGKEKTTLSVVKNTGWMIPYVSCMIVAVGMLAHFWQTLVRFLSRLMRSREAQAAGTMSDLVVPLVVGVLMLAVLLRGAKTPARQEGTPDYAAFGRLPVMYEGRVQPLDTLAQNSLKVLSGYTAYRDQEAKSQPAVRWLLDVIASPEDAEEHKVFRIDHPQLQDLLGLKPRTGSKYGFKEFGEGLGKLAPAAQAAREKTPKTRTPDERKFLELERRLGVLDLLTKSFSPPDISAEHWREDIQRAMRQLSSIDSREPPLVVPPTTVKGNDLASSEKWETFSRGWLRSFVSVRLMEKENSPPVEQFTEVLVAHARFARADRTRREAAKAVAEASVEGRPTKQTALLDAQKAVAKAADEFNQRVDNYHRWLSQNIPQWKSGSVDETLKQDKVDFEAFFSEYAPFYWAMLTYLGALMLSLGGLLGFTRPLNRSAWVTIVVTLCVHSFALWARYQISGRPPVTNLYSSAVFIGWGAVILSLVFEAIFRLGIGNMVGAALGAASLGIAHLLSGDGDTMKVMQAVLDTQFWLWTHVTCITLGYAVTFVAGFFALAQVASTTLLGFRPETAETMEPSTFVKQLTFFATEGPRIVYGSICFGIFFSFVGTVLGGLWADDSWGRFWGWDPKENGALIIVLWNALVLHARWGAMVKERGLAVLAIVGNVVTSWSWFGVNELGVGLHSYGFTEGVWAMLWGFWISQIAAIALGIWSARTGSTTRSEFSVTDDTAMA